MGNLTATVDGEVTVRVFLHKCSGCKMYLGDLPEEELVAVVNDKWGTDVSYFHLSHAPAVVRQAHLEAS